MTEAELKTIEERLALTLPDDYRAIARDYPFPPDSFAAEGMLLDSAEAVIDFNTSCAAIDGVTRPFFIGSDLGEEYYFLDASKPGSPVYVYQLETGKHQVLDATMKEYLDRIRAGDKEIEEDERAAEERHRNRKWWEFWK